MFGQIIDKAVSMSSRGNELTIALDMMSILHEKTILKLNAIESFNAPSLKDLKFATDHQD